MQRAAATAFTLFLIAGRVFAQEPLPVAPVATPPPFERWLTELRSEALARGISSEIVDRAFNGIEPVAQILQRDRTQAEFALDLDTYLERRLTRATVRTAERMYARHRTLLARVSGKYKVSPRVLVAIWGLESNFGRFSGVRPTIPTLVTLAYDPRRSTLFRSELFSALEILDNGDIDMDRLKGSWAGALGQPQFMPSSYLKFAQDFDGDGKRDIWTSQADVFASIAYYLQQHGWIDGERWGREVRIPEGAREQLDALPRRTEGCRAVRTMTVPMGLKEWSVLGLRASSGAALPDADLNASLVTAGSRQYLVYRNYESLLEYNCAHSYALSISLLADKINAP
jgi:membrane-bound lytic murein transglycosylase B